MTRICKGSLRYHKERAHSSMFNFTSMAWVYVVMGSSATDTDRNSTELVAESRTRHKLFKVS